MTPRILDAIYMYNILRGLKKKKREQIDKEKIEYTRLFKISNFLLKVTGDNKYSFYNLTRHSNFFYPVKKEYRPSLEYLKFMEECKAIVAQKEYDKMVSDINPEGWNEHEWLLIKKYSTNLFNVLFSMVATFVSTFYVGELVNWDIGLVIF